MSDRELLELAAKAAGIEGKYGYAPDDYYYNGNVEGICTELPDGRSYVWNPLTDDGDALRLAVKLGISIQHSATIDTQEPSAETFDSENRFGGWFDEVKGSDPYAATRRAIVRAAAEIGRQMEVA